MPGAVVCFGEAMMEVSRRQAGAAHVAYGGDTVNAAIYLARLGAPVAYMTALGTDPWSASLKAAWAAERIDLSLVTTHPTRVPGLYEITTSGTGERSFVYWRDTSAARAFFATSGADAALEQAAGCGLLLLSGVTLAIFTPDERRRIIALAEAVRANGGAVAFDPNWRPRLWSGAADFQEAVLALAPWISVALPSFDDEAAVWGDASPEATMARWRALGVAEVVVKDGAAGVLTVAGRTSQPAVLACDTTGAGDSFNSGYLACRRAGLSVLEAASFGATLAARVVMHPGAIMPADRMPPPPPGLAP